MTELAKRKIVECNPLSVIEKSGKRSIVRRHEIDIKSGHCHRVGLPLAKLLYLTERY